MSGTRRVVAAAALVVALVAGASCTAPPEQVAENVGSALGGFIVLAIVTAICNANPSCESPICMMFPCLPTPPAAEPAPAAPESLAPS